MVNIKFIVGIVESIWLIGSMTTHFIFRKINFGLHRCVIYTYICKYNIKFN